MQLHLYSIYDCKAEAYHPPFVAHNVRDACRRFHRILQEGSIFKGYEEDYSLWQVGLFDDKTGEIVALAGKASYVISAMACLGKEDNCDGQKKDDEVS